MCGPALVVEIPHAAAEALCLRRLLRREDSGKRLCVTEELCLLGHHEVLGAGVLLPIDAKRCRPPLAEHVLADALILGAVTPEEQELRAPSGAHCLLQRL